MNNLWKKPINDFESSAKVVDGNLIISLPDAINPVVWRMELGSVKASALEVRKHGDAGQFLLCLKTPKGETHDIAPFEQKEIAVRALMRVSQALQGAEGKINATSSAQTPLNFVQQSPYNKDGGTMGYKWLVALIGVLFVIFLFAYLGGLEPQQSAQAPSSAAPQTNDDSGVPQSANDILKGF